jgi:hypothetical protein
MGSYKHPRIFLPLDLQIVDLVYDAAWAHIVNHDRSAIRHVTGSARKRFARRYSPLLKAPPISTRSSRRS